MEDCGLEAPRPDRVYLATSLRVAQLWAVCHPAGGGLYRVLPEGVLEADPNPELGAGVSWQCERARIVEAFTLDKATLAQLRAMMLDGAPRESAQ
jgi:MOSC domain-containing protein YiiM